MNILKFLFGIVLFGKAIASFVFLAPMSTFKRIMIKNRFTEQEYLSGIPYLMTFLNCLLSAAWYGLPFVSPNSLLVSILNTIGGALESVYLLIFFIFAPKQEKEKMQELLTFALSFKQRENQNYKLISTLRRVPRSK